MHSRSMLIGVATLLLMGCNGDRATQPVASRSPAVSLDRRGNWGQRGRLVSAVLVDVTDHSAVPAAIRTAVGANTVLQQQALDAFDPRYDVERWRITYTTVGVDGGIAIVSGAVYVPVGVEGPLPLVSLSHGTITSKTQVPSNPTGVIAQGLGHASHGSVIVFADYIGYGEDASSFHPYLIADMGATTSVDALRATRELLKQQGLSLDGRLFVTGYSQGGQIAMALARLLESDPRSGFRVTAVAAMAGPYDLYEAARIVLGRDTPYVPSSISIIYAVAAYQQMYNLADRLDLLLTPSAAAVGERLLTMGMTQAELTPLVPSVASAALQPDVLAAVLTDPEAPLSRALRANETFDWRPIAPLRLYYGGADIDVPPAIALSTAYHMVYDLGAANVEAVKVIGLPPRNAELNHITAQWPSYISARLWFDTFPVPSPELASVGSESY